MGSGTRHRQGPLPLLSLAEARGSVGARVSDLHQRGACLSRSLPPPRPAPRRSLWAGKCRPGGAAQRRLWTHELCPCDCCFRK